MELRPEQLRALDYLRRKGTEAPAARLHEHLATTFRDFEAFLEAIPPELRAVPSPTGGWSAHEVVDHLVESHRPVAEQLRSLVAGTRPATGAVPPGLQSPRPLDRPWDDLLADLRAIHRSFLDLVRGASDDLPLTVTAPVAMVVKVATDDGGTVPVTWEHELDWKAFAQAFRAHTVEHKSQIQRTLAALSATA